MDSYVALAMARNDPILLVDDDPLWRDFFAYVLQRHVGIFAVIAVNGLEAMQIIARQPVSFVLSDIDMPEMDGFALLKNLKLTHPDLPIGIFLTGDFSFEGMKVTRQYLLDQGAAAVFAKDEPILGVIGWLERFLFKGP